MDEQSKFDLEAFRNKRDTQREKGFRQWKTTPADVLSAYKAGERDLEGANLYGANLKGANLYGAYLYGATGIKVVVPVGRSGRLVYAYIYDTQIRVQAGCRNGTPDEIRAAVDNDYASDTDGRADYMDAIELLEKWGMRELARQGVKQTEQLPSPAVET